MKHNFNSVASGSISRTIAALVTAVALTVGMVGAAFAAPVNINKAGAEEIAAALNGVGIKKAREIVTFREKHGAFKSVEQLVDVKGIGDKMVEKNRANLRLQ